MKNNNEEHQTDEYNMGEREGKQFLFTKQVHRMFNNFRVKGKEKIGLLGRKDYLILEEWGVLEEKWISNKGNRGSV